MPNLPVKDDRILPLTRIVLIIVVPFLLLAFLILYLFPQTSGERFAWQIKPNMTALLIGAGYFAGAYQFVFTIFGQRWHRIALAFPPVVAFTIFMFLATVLHWDRFDIRHFPFQVWLVLYIISPFLVTFIWLRNRVTDPGTPEPGDLRVPGFARLGFYAFGVIGLLMVALFFLTPQTLIAVWPWKLTPLTARVLGGWFGLLGIGGIVTGRETRWSAWCIPVQSITLWAVLVLVGALLNPQDFTSARVWNPFSLGMLVGVFAMTVFQLGMELKRMQVKG